MWKSHAAIRFSKSEWHNYNGASPGMSIIMDAGRIALGELEERCHVSGNAPEEVIIL